MTAMTMLLLGRSAYAGSASADLTVSVTVASTCSIATAGLGFGVYDPLAGGQVDASAQVSVACTKGATAAVTLGQGEHALAGSSDAQPIRRMTSGAAYLSYALYSDAVRSAPWGNTAVTGKAYLAASSQPAQLTVYGRIAASQDVPSGVFSDVVVATIVF
jgi:spore coat protein U-like protein